VRDRISCVFHDDRTASLVRKKDRWHCYGACGKDYTLEEVAAKTGGKVDYEYCKEDYEKEDLEESFGRIKALPKRQLRGLEFHCDNRGYYIAWLDGDYYKYRLFNPGNGSKYLGPRGHPVPLFWARRSGSGTLYISEGEINALSIASAVSDSVCSPGSATNFNAAFLSRYLHMFSQYSRIVVVLDKDPAGLKGSIEARAFFMGKLPFVDYIKMEKDANWVLEYEGKQALREILQR
jgi:DNA primase